MAADTKLEGDMPVVRAHWRDRTVTWHAHGLGQLLYELAERPPGTGPDEE